MITGENWQIKVQTAHACIPIVLESTAWAHFSFVSKNGHQDESPALRERISGPREEAKKEGCLEIHQRREAAQGEPAKVSPWWRLLVKAAPPAPAHLPTPPPMDCHIPRAPRAPIPVLQDPGWGYGVERGLFTSTPYPAPCQ